MSDVEQRVPVGVGAIVIKDFKVLIGRRMGKNGFNTWSMPGGHLDPGETPEQAAVRETFEETGVIVDGMRFIGYTNDVFPEPGKHYVTLWMVGRWIDGIPHMTQTREMDNFKWASIDDLPEDIFLPLANLLKSSFSLTLRRAVEGSVI